MIYHCLPYSLVCMYLICAHHVLLSAISYSLSHPPASFLQFFCLFFFMCVCDQTDLCGIRWRKFAFIEPVHEPLNDPILRSYSRCLRENILCVWRRVANKSSIDAFQTGIYEPRPPNSVTHPPLSLRTAKELWIFWYGDEPNLHELLVPELLRASGE